MGCVEAWGGHRVLGSVRWQLGVGDGILGDEGEG